MASFKQLYICIIIGCLLIMECKTIDIGSLTNSISDGFKTIINKVESTICLSLNNDKFDRCKEITQFSSGLDDDNQVKKYCCALFQFKKCVDGVAKQYCGSDAEQTVQFLLDSARKATFPGDCEMYNNFYDCLDPIFFWAILACIAVGIVCCISTVCGCLKRVCCN